MVVWIDITEPYSVPFYASLARVLRNKEVNLLLTTWCDRDILGLIKKEKVSVSVVGEPSTFGPWKERVKRYAERVQMLSSVLNEFKGEKVVHLSFLSPSGFRCAFGLSHEVIGHLYYQLNQENPFVKSSLPLASRLIISKGLKFEGTNLEEIYKRETRIFNGVYEAVEVKRFIASRGKGEDICLEKSPISLFLKPLFHPSSSPTETEIKSLVAALRAISNTKPSVCFHLYPPGKKRLLGHAKLYKPKKRGHLDIIYSSSVIFTVDLTLGVKSTLLGKPTFILTDKHVPSLQVIDFLKSKGFPIESLPLGLETSRKITEKTEFYLGADLNFPDLEKLQDPVSFTLKVIREVHQ